MKELEDYHWFPNSLRRMQMEFIGWMVSTFQIYRPLIPLLNDLLDKESIDSVYDLCAGTGKPIEYLLKFSNLDKAILSDKFPQMDIEIDNALFENKQIDALQADFPEDHLVTMFNAFHHFSEVEKYAILQSISKQGNPCLIAEILRPNVFDLLKIGISTTIGQLLFAPFVRPFSFRRLFFTYIIPINLVTITYDGMVSVLKSSTIKNYKSLLANTDQENYKFKVDDIPSSWGSRITLITGRQKK